MAILYITNPPPDIAVGRPSRGALFLFRLVGWRGFVLRDVFQLSVKSRLVLVAAEGTGNFLEVVQLTQLCIVGFLFGHDTQLYSIYR